MKNLYRSKEQRILGGVCGGIAEYFDIDPVVVRIIFVVLFFADGISAMVYIILWLIIPEYKNSSLIKNVAEEIGDTVSGAGEGSIKEVKLEKSSEDVLKRSADSGILAGIMIVILGALLLVSNLIPQARIWEQIREFWPILLILFGLIVLTKKD